MPKKLELTDKQSAFIDQYLVDYNAKQAAIRAGYAEKQSASMASQLLDKPHIQAELSKRQTKIARKLGVTAERVLEELGRVAFSDIRDLFDDAGNLKPLSDLDKDTAATVAGVQVTSKKGKLKKNGKPSMQYTHRVRQWDKMAALEKLAKHLGMYKEEASQVDINVTIEGRDADCG